MPIHDKKVINNQWWLRSVNPGECLAAFQPIGSTGISQSLQNINSRGTNNAAVGTTPTLVTATGWTFDGATTYLTVGSGAIKDAVPLSMICLFNADDATSTHSLMSVARTSSAQNEFTLRAAGGTSGDPVTAISTQAATARTAASGRGFAALTWCVGAAVFTSATLRTAYCISSESRRTFPNHLEAWGDLGTDTNSNTPASVDTTYIGCTHDSSSTANFLLGKIAACAFYNVALTGKQVLQIAEGMFELVQ